jgi:hypothetical protein
MSMNLRILSLVTRSILCGAVVASASVAAGAARSFSTTQTLNTVAATKDEGEPNHCGERGGASEWHVYKAPANGTLSINTDGSNYDTILAVYTGAGFDFKSFTKVACNNSPGKGGDKVLIPNVVANTIYYIVVDGVGGAKGTAKLNINLGDPPVITTQPANKTVTVGTNVTFTVAATGSADESRRQISGRCRQPRISRRQRGSDFDSATGFSGTLKISVNERVSAGVLQAPGNLRLKQDATFLKRALVNLTIHATLELQ